MKIVYTKHYYFADIKSLSQPYLVSNEFVVSGGKKMEIYGENEMESKSGNT